MRLFGGFGQRCEAAYAEVWPLEEGSKQRIRLYRLYHELNHLNLFGQSYYQTCLIDNQHFNLNITIQVNRARPHYPCSRAPKVSALGETSIQYVCT